MDLMFDLKGMGFQPNHEQQPQAVWSLIKETPREYVSVTMTGTAFEPELTVAYVDKKEVLMHIAPMGANVNFVKYMVRAYLHRMEG